MTTTNMADPDSSSSDPSHAFPSLICPVCSELLQSDDRIARCPAGHSFDRAKEGYLNLLLANQKGSNDPGDDQDSVKARHTFLSAGHYDFLADAIRSHLSLGGTILDAGCGEGHFLRQLAPASGYGVDISRPAIRLASRTHKQHIWIVANVARKIPVSDSSVDVILSILAPRNASEFQRVLKPGGSLVAVIPGPGHLEQLAEQLMAESSDQSQKRGSIVKDLADAFELRRSVEVTTNFVLGTPGIQNLIDMTPLRWKSRRQSLAQIRKKSRLELTAAFCILAFSPHS